MATSAKTGSSSARKKATLVKKKPSTNPKQELLVKVQRHTKPSSVATSTKRAKPLPSDWPVASRPHTLSATNSALRPGSLLQEKCNGQDIHLVNKQALMAPSIARERGRYLFIMPGTFSFKEINKESVAATTDGGGGGGGGDTIKSSSSAAKEADDEDSGKVVVDMKSNDEDDDEDDDDDGDEEQENNSKPAAAAAKPILPQFGNVEGLSTSTPKLRVSFPNSDKSLVFPGTKVDTTSKYIWLNCSAKKKGTVACKGIFSSAIIFGAPVWETSSKGADSEASSSAMLSAAAAAAAANSTSEDENNHDETANKNTWAHYGGSDRTVDGVFKGSKKKTPDDPLTSTTMVPIVSKEPIFDERGLPVRPAMGIHAKASSSPAKKATLAQLELSSEDDDENKNNNNNNNNDSESSDDEYRVSTKTPSTVATKERSAPRRQASAKKTKYTVDLLDSDVEEESSSEEEAADERKPAAAKSKATTKAPQRKKAPTKKTSSTVDLMESDADGEENSDEEAVKETKPKAKKASQMSFLDDDSDSSGFDGGEATRAKQKAVVSKRSKASTGRKSVGSARKGSTKLEEPSSSSEDSFAISDDDAPPTSTGRRSSTRAPRASTSKKSYNEDEDRDDDFEDDSVVVPKVKVKKTVLAKKKASKTSTSAKVPIELSDDSPGSVASPPSSKPASTPASKRQSSVPSRSYQESAESDPESSAVGEDEDEDESPVPTKKTNAKSNVTPKPSRKRKTPPKKTPSGRTTPTSSVLENVESANGSGKKAVSSGRKRKASSESKAEKQDEASHNSRNENQGDIINVDDDEDVVIQKPPANPVKDEVKVRLNTKASAGGTTAASPSLSAASPFRSRRRKSPGVASVTKKSPAKRTVFDLAEDEDFAF